jgi:hypothetical protein
VNIKVHLARNKNFILMLDAVRKIRIPIHQKSRISYDRILSIVEIKVDKLNKIRKTTELVLAATVILIYICIYDSLSL